MPGADVATLASRLLRESECGRSKCKCRVAARRGQGLTHCLIHEDPSPSLNVNVRADKLLVWCHACADNGGIVQALKDADYWPEQQAEYGAAIVASYDYTDAAGKLLYQAVRYVPKGFKQRRPKGKDSWTWSLGDVELVPYRLPELMASENRSVFLVEGEKDVDRLYAAGLVATCNSGGAGKWTDNHSRYLSGRRCYLLPDNDDAGRQHMRAVARSLEAAGALVAWIELPELEAKGDVSDWLDEGGDKDTLVSLARTASVRPPPEPKRERSVRREGPDIRIDVPEAAVVLRFGRIKDRSEVTHAELHMTRTDGSFLMRRGINLLAASGATFNAIVKDLAEFELGQVDWKQVLVREFEAVLDAHRNGLALEWTESAPRVVPPPQWMCEGLVLHNKLNCWLAAGGTGKSTLAKVLCAYHATGFQFLGRETMQGKALYLDWEDDKEEFDRVVYDTCRNLGVQPVPPMGWLRMKGKRLRDNVQSLGRMIVEHGFTLLIIDAVAAAMGGGGDRAKNYDEMAVEFEETLGQLPPITVLALDHVNAQDHREQKAYVPMKARGGERKYEVWRNQFSLVIDEEERSNGRHVVVFNQTKLNRGLMLQPFAVEISYRAQEIAVDAVDISASAEAIERMSATSRLQHELAEQPGLKTVDYARIVRKKTDDKSVNETREQLERHERRGRAFHDTQGRWWPAGMDPIPDPEEPNGAEQLPYWNRDD